MDEWAFTKPYAIGDYGYRDSRTSKCIIHVRAVIGGEGLEYTAAFFPQESEPKDIDDLDGEFYGPIILPD